MSYNIIHGFGAEGALSPGAQLGLDAWWADRMPVALADGQVPVWSASLGKYVPGAGGGGGGGSVTVTDNTDGTSTLTASGGASAVTDNGDGSSALTI